MSSTLTYGSVRGVPGDRHPYRDPFFARGAFREKILRGSWKMKCRHVVRKAGQAGRSQRPGLLPRAGACYTSVSCLIWRPALGR